MSTTENIHCCFNAVILAGSRGPSDPVAAACGVSHKALAPVFGVPMLARVLHTLNEVPRIGRMIVLIECPDLIRDHPAFAPFLQTGKLRVLLAAASPSLSVLSALDQNPTPVPCLITTADHPLLTAEMVDHFLDSVPETADAALGLARSETIQATYPDTRRTYSRFRDGAFSGCNLFVLQTARARSVVTFWRRIEQDRKKPWRMIRALGPCTLLSYALGQLSLNKALAALGRRTATSLAAVTMPFADAAVDVDRPGDLALANDILARRAEVQRRASLSDRPDQDGPTQDGPTQDGVSCTP